MPEESMPAPHVSRISFKRKSRRTTAPQPSILPAAGYVCTISILYSTRFLVKQRFLPNQILPCFLFCTNSSTQRRAAQTIAAQVRVSVSVIDAFMSHQLHNSSIHHWSTWWAHWAQHHLTSSGAVCDRTWRVHLSNTILIHIVNTSTHSSPAWCYTIHFSQY